MSSKSPVSIIRTLGNIGGGYRLVVGTVAGVHGGAPRVMLVSPKGTRCNTVDYAFADSLASVPTPTEPKADEMLLDVVVVEQTASPAPSKTATMPVQEEGETWRPFAGRCKSAGFSWTQASAAYVKPSAAAIATPQPAGTPIVADPIPSDADGAADTDKRITRRQARKLAKASLHSEATSLSDTVKAQGDILAAIAAKLGL